MLIDVLDLTRVNEKSLDVEHCVNVCMLVCLM